MELTDWDTCRLQTLMELRANIVLHLKPSAAVNNVLTIIDALCDLPEIEPVKRKKS